MKLKKLALVAISVLFSGNIVSAERGIAHNEHSPYVKFKSIDIGDAKWTQGFWADKFKLLETTMIPYMGELLTGDIGHGYNNFKIAAGLKVGKAKGFAFHDGDFYKWLEAQSYLYAINKDPKILAQLDEIISVIAQAQQSDGYLQTWSTIRGIEPYSNRRWHEMYNTGHLIYSAIIHHRVTGQNNFLDIAVKNANLVYDTFIDKPEKLARFGFNQTQILALVELYRELKDKRYLELAELFINMRGQSKMLVDDTVRTGMIGDMTQERVPLRKEENAVGHAVLAMYYYAGAADVYAETGEKALIDALKRIWSSAAERKMYVTGAIGQAHHGLSSRKDAVHEAFLPDYNMPNGSAYNETCANITNAMFNWRMLGISGDSKHADIMETVVYNSALSGISADGKHYFYTNPLRRSHKVGTSRFGKKGSTATLKRDAYLNCFCCPPNLIRTLAKLSGWAYSLKENGLVVNLYGGNKLETEMLDGSSIKLVQETQYPWTSDIKFSIKQAKETPFDILLRIPEWAEGASIKINGELIKQPVLVGSYATLNRKWQQGDIIELNLPLEINYIEGNPLIEETRNQVAVKRGPIVYLAETPDLPDGTDIFDVYVPGEAKFKPKYIENFSGNGDSLVTLEGQLLLRRKNESKAMYNKVSKPDFKTFNGQLVPYYAWSNRGTAEMSVFLPVVWGALTPEEQQVESSWWPF